MLEQLQDSNGFEVPWPESTPHEPCPTSHMAQGVDDAPRPPLASVPPLPEQYSAKLTYPGELGKSPGQFWHVAAYSPPAEKAVYFPGGQ